MGRPGSSCREHGFGSMEPGSAACGAARALRFILAWAGDRRARRCAFLAMCMAIALTGCSAQTGIPKATALTLHGDILQLTLSVGCLNDRDFAPYGAIDFRALAKAAEALLRTGSGLSIRLIPDQPMDAQFLMERTAPRNRARYRAQMEGRLLSLAPDADNRSVWERAGRPHGILESLSETGRYRAQSGMPFLYDKLPASDFAWRAFMADQGRYDVVVTNAFIFPDEPSNLPAVRDSRGGVRARLLRTHGRGSLEGWGGLLNINEELRPGGGGVDSRALARRVALVVFSLVFPLSEAEARFAIAEAEAGRALLGACGDCRARWDRRLSLLRAYVLLRESEQAAACDPVLRPGFGAGLYAGVQGARARDLTRATESVVSFCLRKR